MVGQTLFEELVRLAIVRGCNVRHEGMTRGVGAGGFAVVRGVPTVFVDERATLDARIEVLASVLRRMDWSNTYVNPSVRALVSQGSARSETDEAA